MQAFSYLQKIHIKPNDRSLDIKWSWKESWHKILIGIEFKAKSLNWDIDTNNDAFKAVTILHRYLHNNLKTIKQKLAELLGEMDKYMIIGG